VVIGDDETLARIDDDARPGGAYLTLGGNFRKVEEAAKGSLESGFRSWAIRPLMAMLTTPGVTLFTNGASVGMPCKGPPDTTGEPVPMQFVSSREHCRTSGSKYA